MAHRFSVIFLVAIVVLAFIAVGIHGFDYYTTPQSERAFRSDYDEMKPSGYFSHGLGNIGATMITVGVALYSSRKRIRAFWNLGRLSSWLEFHIFLCLVGPVLVIYHTTFKTEGDCCHQSMDYALGSSKRHRGSILVCSDTEKYQRGTALLAANQRGIRSPGCGTAGLGARHQTSLGH